MAIVAACSCGKSYQVEEKYAGKRTRCPACGAVLVVPDLSDEGADLVPLDEDDQKSAMPAAPQKESDQKTPYALASGPGEEADDVATAFGGTGVWRLGRQSEAPSCLALTADGRRGVTAVDETVSVLDLGTKKPTTRFREHDRRVVCVAISDDGRLALSADEKGDWLWLWDAETGRRLTRLDGHDGEILSAGFSPDGRLALSGGEDGRVLLWEVRTGRELACLEGRMPASVRSVSFSPDGQLALAAGGEGRVRLWDVKDCRLIGRLKGGSGEITTAGFSAEGHRVVAARKRPDSKTGIAIWQWDVASAMQLNCFANPSSNDAKVSCVAVGKGGRWLLAAAVTRKPPDLLEGPPQQRGVTPSEVAGLTLGFGLIGAPIVGAMVNMARSAANPIARNKFHILQLWNVEAGTITHTYMGHAGPIHCLAVASKGSRAISGAEDGTVRAWGLPA
jgi:WD40 repeat protein